MEKAPAKRGKFTLIDNKIVDGCFVMSQENMEVDDDINDIVDNIRSNLEISNTYNVTLDNIGRLAR